MKRIKLKDIFEIKKGKKVEPVDESTPNKVRYIQIEDLRDDTNLKYCLPDDKYVYATNDSIIIAWDGANAGTVSYGIEGIIGSTLAVLETKENNIYVPFVGKFLQSKFQYFRDTCTGATIPHVSRKALENLIIPLPSVERQKYISNILEKADSLINKRKAQIEALDQLTQSVFLEMFGDPVKNSKNYTKMPLSEFGTVITGNTPSRKKPEYYGNYIEWIKSDNINTPSHFLTKAEEYLSELGKSKGRIVPANSILVTCIAGSKSSIGNAAIADRSVAFNQQINAIVPNKNINVYFLYVQFLVGKKLVQQASTNSMKGLVSKTAFEQILFINPPYRLQEKYGEIFKKVEEQKNKLLNSLAFLEENYNSLLQRAFKGELFPEKNVSNL